MNEDNLEQSSQKKVGGSEFLVRVLFRQNASWQGEVYHLETNKMRRFRSLLELLMLLQEAMEESEAPAADYVLRSWAEGEAGFPDLTLNVREEG